MNVHYSNSPDTDIGQYGVSNNSYISLYSAPPEQGLTLKEFEQLSFNRLTS